jgi:hypothetical protein
MGASRGSRVSERTAALVVEADGLVAEVVAAEPVTPLGLECSGSTRFSHPHG